VKKTIVWLAVIAAVLGGCKGRESASADKTETIAPAQPKPGATDSDAMTQTVDVEDGRSEAEGGALSTTATTTTTTTTSSTTTTTTKTSTAPPPTTTTH